MTPDAQVALLNKLMRKHLAPNLPEGMGVTLLLFPVNEKGLISYISSAQREDMHEAMRALVEKWDSDDAKKVY
jgi:hypothetical protein